MLVLNFLEHFPQLGAQTWRFHTEPRPIDRKLVDIKEWKKTITAFIVTLIFTNLVVKGITGQSIIIVPPERWAKTQTIENGSVVVENHPILRQVRFLADPTGGFHFGIGVRFESYVFIPVESDQDAPCVFFRDRPPPVSAKSISASKISGGVFTNLYRPPENEKLSRNDIDTKDFADLMGGVPDAGLSVEYAKRLTDLFDQECAGSFAYYVSLPDSHVMGHSNDLEYLFKPPFFVSPFNVSGKKLGSIAASPYEIDLGALTLEFARLDPSKTSTIVVVVCVLSVYTCLAASLVLSGWVPRKHSFVAACGASFKLLTYISLPALLFVAIVRIGSYFTAASAQQQIFWLGIGSAVLVASSLRSIYEINRKLGMNASKFFLSLLTFSLLAQALVIIVAAPVMAFVLLYQDLVSSIP
jgi:hypothetical protein